VSLLLLLLLLLLTRFLKVCCSHRRHLTHIGKKG
jgi:hypothetical protein